MSWPDPVTMLLGIAVVSMDRPCRGRLRGDEGRIGVSSVAAVRAGQGYRR